MKRFDRIELVVLAACSLLIQVPNATAQTNNLSNFQQMQTNAGINAQLMISNTEANVQYHLLHPTTEEVEAKSNALAHLKSPPTWLEVPKRQQILEQSAEDLRLAVDTNQIEAVCAKLTNQPQAILTLRNVTRMAISNLNEAAGFLTKPNLSDYVGQIGYRAEVSTSMGNSYFVFWTSNGPVRDYHKRTAHGDILVVARFYESGKLRYLEINSPNSKGVLRTEAELGFNEDGTLSLHWMRSQ